MKEQVTSRQMMFLLLLNRIATVITVMPIIHMGPANQDIWIMMILSVFYCFLYNLPTLYLSIKFSDLTIIQYMEKIFGKIIGKALGILYGLYFIRIAIIYYFAEIQMIRTIFMDELHPLIIIVVLMLVSVYVATRGLEVSVRTVEFFAPIVIASLILFIVLGFNNIDLTVLLPIIADSTFTSLNLGAMEASLIFTDANLLSMSFPNLTNKKDVFKIVAKSKIYSQAIIILMVVASQVSLGIEQARHLNFPFLKYVRLVKTYSIFERMEAVFLTIWLIIVMTRAVSYLYISSKAFMEVYNQNNMDPFIYIIGIILTLVIFYISYINPKFELLFNRDIQGYYYYITFNLIIPLIAILIYLIRRKDFRKLGKIKN
ncbi:MAG TPA: endospore germination permease [Tissierellaceae bacterium]